MQVSIIVAAALNGAIGKDNRLLWHLPKDLQFFKKLTSGHHILMGRKTFDSIGKPLPNRTSLVVTRSQAVLPEGCVRVNSVKEGIDLAKMQGEKELFVIGGGQIYLAALPFVDTIYLTRVHTHITDADTFFEVPAEGWKTRSVESFQADEKHAYPFDFIVLERT